MPKKRTSVGESRQEIHDAGRFLRAVVVANWPDTGPRVRVPKGALTWAGELVKRCGLVPPVPKDKLDT